MVVSFVGFDTAGSNQIKEDLMSIIVFTTLNPAELREKETHKINR
jgi:hypothetical protein